MRWRWMAMFLLAACVSGEDIKRPHPTRCDMFYALKSCAPGLHFNAKTGMCDLPSRANCNKGRSASNNTATQPNLDRQLVLSFPHPSDCTYYYNLGFCPDGLHFNPTFGDCDFPQSSGCITVAECSSLTVGKAMTITPPTCTTGSIKEGNSCNFSCAQGYQLKGSDSMICTASGWNSTQGLNFIPTCMTATEIAEDMVKNIEEEINSVNASLLFALDESGSITKENFPKEILFIESLVSAFPLSERRSSGVILFSNKSSVEITVKTSDTCTFLKQADEISYHAGGTNITLAIKTANQEIFCNGVYKKNLVLLITDGKSSDPSSEANILKDRGNVLFTIGIAGYEKPILESIASFGKLGGKLFYGITDFAVFEEVARHLETTYLKGTKDKCMTATTTQEPQ